MSINYTSSGYSIERNEILSIMQPKKKDRYIISETDQNKATLLSKYGEPVFNECGDAVFADAQLIAKIENLPQQIDATQKTEIQTNVSGTYYALTNVSGTYGVTAVVSGMSTTNIVAYGTGNTLATFNPICDKDFDVVDIAQWSAGISATPVVYTISKLMSPTHVKDGNGNPMYLTYTEGLCEGAFKYTGSQQLMALDEQKYKPRTQLKLTKPCDPALGMPKVFVNGYELQSKSYIFGALHSVNITNPGQGFSSSSRIDYVEIAESGTGYPQTVDIEVIPHPMDVKDSTIEQELELSARVLGGAIAEIIVDQVGIGYFYEPTIRVVDSVTGEEIVAGNLIVSKGGTSASSKFGVDSNTGYRLLSDGATSILAGSITSPTSEVYVEIGRNIFKAENKGDGTWTLKSKDVTQLLDNGRIPFAVYAKTGSGEKVYDYNTAGVKLTAQIKAIVKELSVPYEWKLDTVDKNSSNLTLPSLKIKTGNANGVVGGVVSIEVLDRGYGFKRAPQLIIKDPVLGDVPSERTGSTFVSPVVSVNLFDIPRETDDATKFFYNRATNTIEFDEDDGLESIPNPLSPTGRGIRQNDEIVVEYYIDSDESSYYMDIDGLMRRLATDLCIHPYDKTQPQPFQLIYPIQPSVDPVTKQQSVEDVEAAIDLITTTFVVESEKGVDLLSSAENISPNSDFMPSNPNMINTASRTPQKWRIKFEWDPNSESLRVFVGTKYQIKDDGSVSKPRGREGIKTAITRLPGELCEVFYSDTSTAYDQGSSAKSKTPFFIRSNRNMIEQHGTYPLTYRLTVTDHGMAFHIMEQGDQDSDQNHAWFVVQRHVDNRSGKWEMEDGYSPVHCVYSPSKIDSKYRQAQMFDEFSWYDIEQSSVGSTSYTPAIGDDKKSANILQFTDSIYTPSERYVARNVTQLKDSSGTRKVVETPVVVKYQYSSSVDYSFTSDRSSSYKMITPSFGGSLDSDSVSNHVNGPYGFSLLKAPNVVGYTNTSKNVFTRGGVFGLGNLPNIPGVGKFIATKQAFNAIESTIISGITKDLDVAKAMVGAYKSFRDTLKNQGSSYLVPNDTLVDSSGNILASSFSELAYFSNYASVEVPANPNFPVAASYNPSTGITSGKLRIFLKATITYNRTGGSDPYVYGTFLSISDYVKFLSGGLDITGYPTTYAPYYSYSIPHTSFNSLDAASKGVSYTVTCYYLPFNISSATSAAIISNEMIGASNVANYENTGTAAVTNGSQYYTKDFTPAVALPSIKSLEFNSVSGNLVRIDRKTATTRPQTYIRYKPNVGLFGLIGVSANLSTTATTPIAMNARPIAAGSSIDQVTRENILKNLDKSITQLDDFIYQCNEILTLFNADKTLLSSFDFTDDKYKLFSIKDIPAVTTFNSTGTGAITDDDVGEIISSIPTEYFDINGEITGAEASNIVEYLPPRPDNLTYFEVYQNGNPVKAATNKEYELIPNTKLGYSIKWLPAIDPGTQQFALDSQNDRIWLRYPAAIGDDITVKYYLNNDSVSPAQTVLIKRIYDQEFPQMEDINETKAIYRFVVREKDILTPTPIHKLATIHQVDSFAIINPLEQISITSDRTYVYMFPGPLTTNRFLYPNSELDLFCYSSAENSAHTSLIRVGTETNLKFDHDAIAFGETGSVSQTELNYRDEYKYPDTHTDVTRAGKNWNLDSTGKKLPRLYQGMMSTLPNGNGMRIFLLSKFGPIRPDFSDIVESEFTVLN